MIELESDLTPLGSTPEAFPKSTMAVPDCRAAVPCLTTQLIETCGRFDPGLFSVAVYGTPGPSTNTTFELILGTLSVGQGASVTGNVAVARTSVPFVSCSS